MVRKRQVIKLAIHPGAIRHFLRCCLNLVLSLLLVQAIFYQEEIVRKTFKKLPGNVEMAPRSTCLYISEARSKEAQISGSQTTEIMNGKIIYLKIESSLITVNGLNLEILPELKSNLDKKNVKYTVYKGLDFNVPAYTGITKLPFVFEERNLVITFKEPLQLNDNNNLITVKIEMIGTGRIVVPLEPRRNLENTLNESCPLIIDQAYRLINTPNIVLRGESTGVDINSLLRQIID